MSSCASTAITTTTTMSAAAYGYTSPAPSEEEQEQNPRDDVADEEINVDDMTDEELDMWFANCVPLSNLPTPPPAKECCTQLGIDDLQGSSVATTTTETYAATLCDLLPSNVYSPRSRASCTATIARFLERAQLPAEIVAFAACVLDAVSLRFAGAWREACLFRGRRNSNYSQSLGTFTSSSLPDESYFAFLREHARTTARAEVIPLAALAIAYGFLADKERSSRYWAQGVTEGMVSLQEVEATKWCLLRDIDYGLMHITEETVGKMLERMKGTMAAGNHNSAAVSELEQQEQQQQQQKDDVATTTTTTTKDKKGPRTLDLDAWRGTAVWVHGVHTPEPSP